MPREPLRTISWRPDGWQGHDTATLYRLDSGWEVSGAADATLDVSDVLLSPEQAAFPTVQFQVAYTLIVDERWQARTVRIQLSSHTPKLKRDCTLSVNQHGAWKQKSGNMAPDLWFLTDIYGFALDITPAMRVQQVRGLNLEPGQEKEVEAVRLNLPDFTVDPVFVLLERTGETTYTCLETNGGLTLESQFTVDDLGLVVDQDGSWTRIAEAATAAGS
ncbi:MAG: putative glycolipid-binding domain-containing protein [Thermomicrobiales bacterium]|nr:putative glycolipid-binding domain-containing protein [Thermomicrobiales bacterium]